MSQTIPKIIHQIWIGEKKPPYIWIDTWKNDYITKYPEWKYMLWDNEKSKEILNKYPKMKAIFNEEKKWCGKADILRYIILYEYGGVYIDADSTWVNEKDLGKLITDTNESGVFAANHNHENIDLLANGVFGCIKQSPIILEIIRELEKYTVRKYREKRLRRGPSKVTGPVLFSQIRKHNVTMFPPVFFYPIHWEGITNINHHKYMDLPKESYMFQYGLTTNSLDF